jgi:hypothetical protein
MSTIWQAPKANRARRRKEKLRRHMGRRELRAAIRAKVTSALSKRREVISGSNTKPTRQIL